MALTDFPFKWSDPEAEKLLKGLIDRFSTVDEVALALNAIGMSKTDFAMVKPVKAIWYDIVRECAARGKIAKLVDLLASPPQPEGKSLFCTYIRQPFMTAYDMSVAMNKWRAEHKSARVINVQYMVENGTSHQSLLVFYEE